MKTGIISASIVFLHEDLHDFSKHWFFTSGLACFQRALVFYSWICTFYTRSPLIFITEPRITFGERISLPIEGMFIICFQHAPSPSSDIPQENLYFGSGITVYFQVGRQHNTTQLPLYATPDNTFLRSISNCCNAFAWHRSKCKKGRLSARYMNSTHPVALPFTFVTQNHGSTAQTMF